MVLDSFALRYTALILDQAAIPTEHSLGSEGQYPSRNRVDRTLPDPPVPYRFEVSHLGSGDAVRPGK